LPGFAISELVVNTTAITSRPVTKQTLFFISTSFYSVSWGERGVEESSRSGATKIAKVFAGFSVASLRRCVKNRSYAI
jgi:hypothetical protein